MDEQILIVDDHAETAQLMVRLFNRRGMSATCVTNGPEALDYVTRHIPAAVILDYMMPDMDGLEVLRRMRAMGDGAATVPVALYTATRSVWLRDQAMLLGVHEIWPKGDIAFDEIERRVGELLA